MPLLMVDLDNTLVDRDAAFRRAVRRFLTTHGPPFEDLAWAMAVDEGGYAPRGDVATAMSRRWSGRVRAEDVGELLRSGGAPFVTLEPETEVALRRAVAAGWTTVVVTNGTVEQQLSKLRVSGLDRIVAGWIVSEALGYRKPEPEIFAAAADTVGRTLGGAWMIGDSAHTDIARCAGRRRLEHLALPRAFLAGGPGVSAGSDRDDVRRGDRPAAGTGSATTDAARSLTDRCHAPAAAADWTLHQAPTHTEACPDLPQ